MGRCLSEVLHVDAAACAVAPECQRHTFDAATCAVLPLLPLLPPQAKKKLDELGPIPDHTAEINQITQQQNELRDQVRAVLLTLLLWKPQAPASNRLGLWLAFH